VDVFLPDEVELEGVTGVADCAGALRSLENGRTLTVAKLGSRGAMLRKGGTVLHRPAFAITPVDTTGAGDSFNAGFLHAWLGGRPLDEALVLAAACGALSTRGMGGIGGQATLAEAEAFVRDRVEQAGVR
jgi:sugar/nucleoside kinase (ribokinase family)